MSKENPDDLTVFECIKRFKKFKIGDSVIWNRLPHTITALPEFRYRIYYESGAFSEYHSKSRWDGQNFKTQEVVGYELEDSTGKRFRLNILANIKPLTEV